MKRFAWLAGLIALVLLAGWLAIGREAERGAEGHQEAEPPVAKKLDVALAPPATGEHEEPMQAAAREPAVQTLGNAAGQRGKLDFVATRGDSSAELSVSGRVLDESGAPVDAFVVVAARGFSSNPRALQVPHSQGFREARGAFTLGGLDEGTWTLTATSEEFADSEAVSVAVPDAGHVTLVLRSAASLSGTVIDPTGAPVPDALVELEGVQTTRAQTFSPDRSNARTDVQGRFTIERAVPGWATLTASSSGFAPSEPLRLELVRGRVSAGHLLQLQPGGTITGEVATGLGSLGGLIVIAEGADAQYDTETDSEGRFSFVDLPAGWFWVYAETEIGLELQAEVELPVGGTVHVRLAPESTEFVRLFGRITVGDVEGRQYGVRAVLPESARGSSGETDSEGNYALTLAGPGRYLVWIDWSERQTALWGGMIDVPSVREHRLDLVIPVAKIRGRVTSSTGEPVPGIYLRATSAIEDSESQSHTTTDSDGRYELFVTAEPLVLVAAGDRVGRESSWLPARRDLTVAPGETRAGIDFVLWRGGTLAVRVKNADGSSASDVTLWERVGAEYWTGNRIAGTFTFESLSPGRHLFGAEGKDRASPFVAVDVVAGETTTLELVLEPATWVKVTFPGLPEASEELVVTLLEGGEQLPFASSWEGRAFLGPLIAGSYVVRARCGSLSGERVLEIRGDEGMLELTLTLE